MDHEMLHANPLGPLALYLALVLALAVAMIAVSYLLGERHRERATGEPYESGVPPTGSAWIRLNIKYYLFAVFFVILDVESVFIFAWAVAIKETGWPGYFAMVLFVGILLVALFYLWRTGALSWAGPGEKQNGA